MCLPSFCNWNREFPSPLWRWINPWVATCWYLGPCDTWRRQSQGSTAVSFSTGLLFCGYCSLRASQQSCLGGSRPRLLGTCSTFCCPVFDLFYLPKQFFFTLGSFYYASGEIVAYQSNLGGTKDKKLLNWFSFLSVWDVVDMPTPPLGRCPATTLHFQCEPLMPLGPWAGGELSRRKGWEMVTCVCLSLTARD